MAGFISALIKQRKDAKKSKPDTNGRLKEIIDIIRKYDYSDGITPDIVVGIVQDLGPTFVKIGQIASQQSEQIPPEYCDALVKLRSSVAPMDVETVHAQIEKHLGEPANEIFATFDDEPLGSASIGQVHRATLHDGTVVAVKVRRPGVVDTVARDFALIEKVLDTFFKNGIAGFDLKSFIVELEQTSKLELDFTNEAANLERFWQNNASRAGVSSPKCYRELTNEAILTEDFVMGAEVGKAAYLETLSDEVRDQLAGLVADNFATQVLVDGFYHADPHSGNVLIQELDEVAADADAEAATEPVADAAAAAEGATATEPAAAADAEAEAAADTDAAAGSDAAADTAETTDAPELPAYGIEWIDFGMMGQLSQTQRQHLLDLVSAIVMQDAYALKRTVLKVAQPQGEIDHGALLELCEGVCDNYTGSDLGDFDLGELLGTILTNLQDESYDIDPFLTNLARGIIAVEGTVKTLSPRINVLNFFLDKVDLGFGLDLDNIDLENIADAGSTVALKLLQYFASVSKSSTKTAETLDMLEKGQIKVRTEFSLEDKTLGTFDRYASYAIRAVIVLALIIGSCLLCTVPIDAMATTPLLVAFPVAGSIGLIVGLFCAYRLSADLKKDNK